MSQTTVSLQSPWSPPPLCGCFYLWKDATSANRIFSSPPADDPTRQRVADFGLTQTCTAPPSSNAAALFVTSVPFGFDRDTSRVPPFATDSPSVVFVTNAGG